MRSRTPRDRDAFRTNVTETASVLVGRERDMAGIAARFDAEGARLVTVVAPGGMGKTRLVGRFAASRIREFSQHGGGGAWCLDVTQADTPAALCLLVASALGATLDAGISEREAIETVARAIARRKHILLVLDNFEQLTTVARALLRTWLEAAPQARFVIASRVVVGVPEEHLWPLGPLAVPTVATDRATLRDVESVDLFVRRARAVCADFAPTDADLAMIADIVRGADGIPLAIELAAARAAVLSIAQIRDRLHAPLALLARGDDDGKHSSMRRAIAGSFTQLDERTRGCLIACGIFRGGFTLEAAERVIGGVLPQLEALHASSLLRSTRQPDGAIRFSFYETIREFAMERRADLGAEWEALAGRHAQYFAEIADAFGEGARTTRGAAAQRALARDADDLEAAWTVALDRTRTRSEAAWGGIALRLVGMLDLARASRGMPHARIETLNAAVDAARRVGLSDTEALAEVLLARANAYRDAGDFEAARDDVATGLEIAQRAGSPWLEALAHTHAGELIELSGATPEARHEFACALAQLRRVPDGVAARLREADARARLGHTLRREGDLAQAEREIERAMELYRGAGDDEGLCRMLYEAATISLFRKSYAASQRRFEEGLSLAHRIDARTLEAALTTAFGTMLLDRGDLDDALEHHTRGVRLFRDLGNRLREGSALYYLACNRLLLGERDEGERTLRTALEIVRTAGMRRYEVLIEGCLATILADRAEIDSARAAMQRADDAVHACRTEPALVATLDIHRGHVDVALGVETDAPMRLTAARALADQQPCDDPRFALRWFEQRDRPRADAAKRSLTLAPEARRFRLSEPRTVVDLTRRGPLRRILAALAKQRVDAPGEGLSVDDIISAGWPGERIARAAAVNRAYVALASLRRLGLREVILGGESGYQLTTRIRVEWEPEETPHDDG